MEEEQKKDQEKWGVILKDLEDLGWHKEDLNVFLALSHPLTIIFLDTLRRKKSVKRAELIDIAKKYGYSEGKVRACLSLLTETKIEGCEPLVKKNITYNGMYDTNLGTKIMKAFGVIKIPESDGTPEEGTPEEVYETKAEVLRVVIIKKGIKGFRLLELGKI